MSAAAMATRSGARPPRWEGGLAPHERFLLNVVRYVGGHAVDTWPDAGREWPRVWQLAQWHRLLPAVAFAARRAPGFPCVPPADMAGLDAFAKWSTTRVLQHTMDLNVVARAMADAGIEVVAFKGISLARALYPEPWVRTAGDLDILVRRADLRGAEAVLQSLGYAPRHDGEVRAAYSAFHHHLVPYVSEKTGTVIEVHHALVRPNRTMRFDVGPVWSRLQRAPGRPYATMASDDQLVHLCLHFLTDRLGRRPGALLQMLDIILLLGRPDDIDWARLQETVRRNDIAAPVYKALHAATRIAGGDWSGHPMERLRPASFKEADSDLFVRHRVIGTWDDVPLGLVKALGEGGHGSRWRRLYEAFLPPTDWTPDGNDRERPSRVAGVGRLVTRPVQVILGTARVLGSWRRVRAQARVQRWIDSTE